MTEKKQDFIKIKIINGKYKNIRAQFNVRNSSIEIQSSDIIMNDRGEKEYRIIRIEERQFKSVERKIYEIDNSLTIAIIFASVITIGVTFYRLGYILEYYSGLFEFLVELMFSTVSGVIWGGLVYLIAKFFKHKVNVIRIITKANELIDILDEPIISSYFIHTKQIENVNNTDIRKYSINKEEVSFHDKYEDLIKLDTLLKQGIINNNEFEIEKNKILSKRE